MRGSRAARFAVWVGLLGSLGVSGITGQEASRVEAGAEPVFRSVVRLVQVHATVMDGKRRYVRGLTAENFRILDNGVRQDVVAFEADDAGFSCALLIDSTGSMKKELPTLKRALLEFIDSLRAVDSVAVYAFSTELERLQVLTPDKDDAKRAVLRIRAAGATALFDAVYRVTKDLGTVAGKKALLVFTDGDDNASVLHARAAIGQAREIGVPVFAAAQGTALADQGLMEQIEELAHDTGGLAFAMKKSSHARKIVAAVADSLRHGYLLAYRAPAAATRQWRQIAVAVAGVKRPRVRAKSGYLATPSE